MNSDRYFCLPFFDVFCAEVHPVRRQKLRHVCNVGTTNDVNENPIKSETETLGVVGILKYCAN